MTAGQNSSDLDYASTAALGLSGGTIEDTAGNTAALTLPATGTDGLATTNIVIDTATLTVFPADWISAGLTLTLGSDGNLCVYLTGTTPPTDVVVPCPPADLTNVEITAPSNIAANLTIDSTNGNPIPAGGLTYTGPEAGKTTAGLIITGSGVVTLSGTDTYTGGTVVSAGTLIVTSSTCAAEQHGPDGRRQRDCHIRPV